MSVYELVAIELAILAVIGSLSIVGLYSIVCDGIRLYRRWRAMR